MKYTLRVLPALLLALTLTLPLVACNGGSWRDDVTATQLTDSITAALPAGYAPWDGEPWTGTIGPMGVRVFVKQ